MRILHIIDTMSPAAGGPTELVRMLVHCAPPGYTSEVVTTDAPDAAFLRELGCPAHGLGDSHPHFYTPALLPWLRAHRRRFDGVIVHGLWQWTGIAARLAFRGRVPYFVFPHGMLDPWFARTYPGKHLKKYPFWLLAEYWNLRAATRTLFTTARERDLAATSFHPYDCRPTVVALGTSPSPPDTAALRDVFFTVAPDLRDRRFLLYLGRIHPKKGADLLMEAFTAISPANPDVHLVIAGPDADGWAVTLRSNLPAAVATRVHWPGLLLGDAKYGAFAASEAFILPSHQENFGIAVVEALAAGRPALLTDAVNIAPEIIADNAGLSAPDTPAGIHSLLTRWLALTPDERSAMSTNAAASFARRYDIRENAAAILRLFDQRAAPKTQTSAPKN